MCLSFKRHPELCFFSLSLSLPLSISSSHAPLPTLFFPPSPRHLVLLRHSYKNAAEVPAHGDAGAGRGSVSPGPEQALFQKVQGGNVSFFMRNPGTGAALEAAAGAGSSLCPGAGSELAPAAPGPAPRAPLVLRAPSIPLLLGPYGNRLHLSVPAKATPPHHKKTPNPRAAPLRSVTTGLGASRSHSSVTEAGNAENWDGDVGLGSSPLLTHDKGRLCVWRMVPTATRQWYLKKNPIPLPISPGKYQIRDRMGKEEKLPPGKYAGPELAFPSPLTGFTGKVSKPLHSPGCPALHRYFSHSSKPRSFSPPRPSGGRAHRIGP